MDGWINGWLNQDRQIRIRIRNNKNNNNNKCVIGFGVFLLSVLQLSALYLCVSLDSAQTQS